MRIRRLQFETLEPRDLLAVVPQSLPVLAGFESGLPADTDGWEFVSTNTGLIEVAGGALQLSDSRADAAYSLNEAVLHVDLSGAASADLILDHFGATDEPHRFTKSMFAGNVKADLIAVSLDGLNWVKLADLTTDFVGRTIPLDTALSAAESLSGISDRSDVRIKLQQYDNGPAPGDGRRFDNVRVVQVERPNLKVEGNGQAILTGAIAAQAADGTLFRPTTTQGTLVHEFVLRNAGEGPLVLDASIPLRVSGKHAADFLIVSQPDLNLAPGESATFAVAFAPSGTGTRLATMSIASNDALKPVFTFALSGAGVKAAVGPLVTSALVGELPTPQAVTRDVQFVERFDLGLPAPSGGWELRRSRDGVIDVLSGQLRLSDSRHDSVFSLNEAILHLDLRNVGSVELTLDMVGKIDDKHTFTKGSFAGSANADLVAISVDGVNWVKVADLGGDLVGKTFALDDKLALAQTLAGTADRSRVRIKFQQYDNSTWATDGRLFDNIRVSAILLPKIGIEGNGLPIAVGAKTALATDGTQFGSAAAYAAVTHQFIIRNTGNDPLFLTGAALVQLGGKNPSAFAVVDQPDSVVQPGASTTFAIAFTPGSEGVRTATVTILSNDRAKPSYSFTIAGTGTGAPVVENGPAAPGKRVKMIAPEYAGTQVYHTVYLPTNWTPDRLFPVIVEYAPNSWAPSGSKGTVEDTQLGYYLSKGEDFIWVTMPFIGLKGGTYWNATTWWGNGQFGDTGGLAMTASYTLANLPRILEQFGGDPSRVLVTGFSRGAIATSAVALLHPQIADLWLAFIPHSHHDLDTSRLFRVAGRASFITYGSNDGGMHNSIPAGNNLRSWGFPTVERVLPGLGHTDSWVQDNAPASSVAVRNELRDWIDDVLELRPGTHSISGRVTNSQGAGLAGVRVQSGASHFTFTDAGGNYELPGLIDGQRTITARFGQQTQTNGVVLTGSNLSGRNFVFST